MRYVHALASPRLASPSSLLLHVFLVFFFVATLPFIPCLPQAK